MTTFLLKYFDKDDFSTNYYAREGKKRPERKLKFIKYSQAHMEVLARA